MKQRKNKLVSHRKKDNMLFQDLYLDWDYDVSKFIGFNDVLAEP